MDLRPSSSFPFDPAALDRAALETHYSAMRRSHIFMARSQGQMKRRAKEFIDKKKKMTDSLRAYQEKVTALGWEKAEQMQAVKDLQQELEAFVKKDQAFTQLLSELEDAKEKTGFWNIVTINRLLERMRKLLGRDIQTLGSGGGG